MDKEIISKAYRCDPSVMFDATYIALFALIGHLEKKGIIDRLELEKLTAEYAYVLKHDLGKPEAADALINIYASSQKDNHDPFQEYLK